MLHCVLGAEGGGSITSFALHIGRVQVVVDRNRDDRWALAFWPTEYRHMHGEIAFRV